MAYMPANATGCALGLLYCALGVLLLVVPKVIFPDSRFVTGYQIVMFFLLWWLGLRFAKRHSA